MIVLVVRLHAQQLVVHLVGLVAGSELGAQAAKQAQGTVGLYLAEAVSRHEDVWILMLAAGKDKAEQKERDEVMYLFRASKIDILIATDIVSRGIDIDDITLVINYDVPHDAEDYVHRIGRTARAGAGGNAITLVSEKDQNDFMKIENFLGHNVEKMPIPKSEGQGPEYDGKFRGHKSSRGNHATKGTRGHKGKYKNGGHGRSHKKKNFDNTNTQNTDTQKKA